MLGVQTERMLRIAANQIQGPLKMHERSKQVVNDGGTAAQRVLRANPRLESAKTGARRLVQASLDAMQFRFDTFPRLLYQPVPWAGKTTAGRAHGSVERWNAIKTEVDRYQIESALDIGCQAGYFTISLAEHGIATMGVDIDERSLRIARYAARRAGVGNAGLCNLLIDPETVTLLPTVDATLLLSVWHHWVYSFGVDQAGLLLADVWQRCGQVMFFETGEDEMPPEFGLPKMGDDAPAWIADYLARHCAGSQVETLGKFQAFGVGGNETNNVVYRTLFAVRRTHNCHMLRNGSQPAN